MGEPCYCCIILNLKHPPAWVGTLTNALLYPKGPPETPQTEWNAIKSKEKSHWPEEIYFFFPLKFRYLRQEWNKSCILP